MGIWFGVASEFTWRPFGIMHVESHNNNNSGLSARDDLEARSSGSRRQSRDPVPVTGTGGFPNPPSPADAMPDMVIWAVYACMLGRTRRSAAGRLRGGLLSSLGGFVIRIRILMYRDVSCVYPEGYMYPSCILMYLKCILNALLHSKRIHILIFCMYFTRIPNESRIHFGIHIRYIKIHVSCALPWCHTGYISGYIRIRVLGLFITIHLMIHQDTPRYKITIHVSWTRHDEVRI
jgi:hypothetical protein